MICIFMMGFRCSLKGREYNWEKQLHLYLSMKCDLFFGFLTNSSEAVIYGHFIHGRFIYGHLNYSSLSLSPFSLVGGPRETEESDLTSHCMKLRIQESHSHTNQWAWHYRGLTATRLAMHITSLLLGDFRNDNWNVMFCTSLERDSHKSYFKSPFSQQINIKSLNVINSTCSKNQAELKQIYRISFK